MQVIYLALFGALGVLARAGTNQLVIAFAGLEFPWSTLIINILGSFVMGFVMGGIGQKYLQPTTVIYLTTGFLGGYTTFSTFSLDGLLLLQKGRIGPASAYLMGSVLLGMGAVALGFYMAQHITSLTK